MIKEYKVYLNRPIRKPKNTHPNECNYIYVYDVDFDSPGKYYSAKSVGSSRNDILIPKENVTHFEEI